MPVIAFPFDTPSGSDKRRRARSRPIGKGAFARTSHVLSCILILLLGTIGSVHSAELPRYRILSIASALSAPTGIAVDDGGSVFVTESSGNRLVVFDRFGAYVKELKGLQKPTGVAVDRSGRVIVCNTGRKTVDVYDRNLAYLYRLGRGGEPFLHPTSVACDSTGTVFVVDSKANRVQVFDPSGSFLHSFGGAGNGDGQFNFPVSVAVDETSGEVIVSDLQATLSGCRGARVQVFSRDGVFRRKFGGFGEGEGLFIRPMGVAVDGSGRIYVADSYQNVVQVLDAAGAFLRAVHDPDHPLRTPLGIAYDRKSDRLYIASLNTSRVEVFGTTAGGGELPPPSDPPSLTFFSSGGGGSCSVAGYPPGGEPPALDLLVPVALLLFLRIARRRNAAEGRDRSCARGGPR